jgi:hypothetical protein
MNRLLVFSKRSVLALAILTGLTACQVEEKDLATTFDVQVPFTMMDKNQKPFSFQRGSYANQWDIDLITDGNQKALVIQSHNGSGIDIPIRVPSNFYIGSGDIQAEESGQNIAISQTTSNYQSVNDRPYTTTETCSIVSTEHVCDSTPKGQQCFDRTVTKDGQRSVTITHDGSTQDVQMTLMNANGMILAKIAVHQDNTSDNRNAGPCQ